MKFSSPRVCNTRITKESTQTFTLKLKLSPAQWKEETFPSASTMLTADPSRPAFYGLDNAQQLWELKDNNMLKHRLPELDTGDMKCFFLTLQLLWIQLKHSVFQRNPAKMARSKQGWPTCCLLKTWPDEDKDKGWWHFLKRGPCCFSWQEMEERVGCGGLCWFSDAAGPPPGSHCWALELARARARRAWKA